jgi:L-amino acid N-acyltransferase YncA
VEQGRPGQWKLKEIAGTDKFWPAELVLLAMGFKGPEQYVAKCSAWSPTRAATTRPCTASSRRASEGLRRRRLPPRPVAGGVGDQRRPRRRPGHRQFLMGTLEVRAAWFQEHDEHRYPVIVAEAEGEVVGWGSLSKFRTRAGYDPTCEATVYIRHDCHRRGIGRAILIDLIAAARQAGFHTILGGASAEQTASIALQESLGFVRVAHLPRGRPQVRPAPRRDLHATHAVTPHTNPTRRRGMWLKPPATPP